MDNQLSLDEQRKKILEALCKLANEYEEKRNIYWQHYRSLRLCSHSLSIPLLFITSFTGATSCIQVSDFNGTLKGLPILISVLGVSSAILTALQKYMRFAERSETSKYISKMYGLIATKIKGQIQVTLAGHNLPNQTEYDKFLDDVNKEVQSLQLEIDVVPKALMEYEYHREFDISQYDTFQVNINDSEAEYESCSEDNCAITIE